MLRQLRRREEHLRARRTIERCILISATTPTIVRHGVLLTSVTRWPIALSFGQYVFAIVWFTTTTNGASAPSPSLSQAALNQPRADDLEVSSKPNSSSRYSESDLGTGTKSSIIVSLALIGRAAAVRSRSPRAPRPAAYSTRSARFP